MQVGYTQIVIVGRYLAID